MPLVALPILIHLINQRRYQTTHWAAMMFLRAAHRMSRGYARLRQWLILLFRMLAIAGLILAVGRPWPAAGSGWRPGAEPIRRSSSGLFSQHATARCRRRRVETGGRAAATGGYPHHAWAPRDWVLIESTTNQPRELQSPSVLLDLSCTEPTGAEADLPAMLEAARTYIQANQTGRTEIWICSDLRENDWHADSGRWRTLRESFLELAQGVRFHLLAYPQSGDRATRRCA